MSLRERVKGCVEEIVSERNYSAEWIGAVIEKHFGASGLLINHNQYVHVELTEYGHEMYRIHIASQEEHAVERFGEAARPIYEAVKKLPTDERGWAVMPLWEMMIVFGPLLADQRNRIMKTGNLEIEL